MTQGFCPACKRIFHGKLHNCMRHIKTPENIVVLPFCSAAIPSPTETANAEWIREAKKACNERCPHWIKKGGGGGCRLCPGKPCDIGYFLRKGFGCFDKENPRFEARPKPKPLKFPDWQVGNDSGQRAIVTVAVGEAAQELATVTLPAMRRYAERCQAELIVLDTDQYRRWPIANKFATGKIAARFDRTLFLDIDCYVRESCPDLFDHCEPGAVWMHRDLPYTRTQRFLQRDAKRLEQGGQKIECWNSGVVVMDREHAHIWDAPSNIVETSHTLEQTAVELNAKLSGVRLRELPIELNCQYWMREPFWDHFESAKIVHLAGAKHETRMAILRMLATEGRPDESIRSATRQAGSTR